MIKAHRLFYSTGGELEAYTDLIHFSLIKARAMYPNRVNITQRFVESFPFNRVGEVIDVIENIAFIEDCNREEEMSRLESWVFVESEE